MNQKFLDSMLPPYVQKLIDVIRPSLPDARQEFDDVDLTQCAFTSELNEAQNGIEFVFENCWILGLTDNGGVISCRLQSKENFTAVVSDCLQYLAHFYLREIITLHRDAA